MFAGYDSMYTAMPNSTSCLLTQCNLVVLTIYQRFSRDVKVALRGKPQTRLFWSCWATLPSFVLMLPMSIYSFCCFLSSRSSEKLPPRRAILDHSSQSMRMKRSSSCEVTAHLVVFLTFLIRSSWNISMRYFWMRLSMTAVLSLGGL